MVGCGPTAPTSETMALASAMSLRMRASVLPASSMPVQSSVSVAVTPGALDAYLGTDSRRALERLSARGLITQQTPPSHEPGDHKRWVLTPEGCREAERILAEQYDAPDMRTPLLERIQTLEAIREPSAIFATVLSTEDTLALRDIVTEMERRTGFQHEVCSGTRQQRSSIA